MAKASTAPAGAFFANWRQNIIYIGFVVIFVVFALTLNDKGFLNPNNLLNIVRQTAMIAGSITSGPLMLSGSQYGTASPNRMNRMEPSEIAHPARCRFISPVNTRETFSMASVNTECSSTLP